MFLQISKLWIKKTSKCEEEKTRNLQFTLTHFDDSQLGKIFANAKDVEEFSAQVSSIFLWLLEPPTDWHPATGAASARHTHSCSTCNIFVKIAKRISPNRKMYFSKSQNVFLQIATHLFVIFFKCICPPTGTVWQIYCSPWHNIQLESLHSWTSDWRADTAKDKL